MDASVNATAGAADGLARARALPPHYYLGADMLARDHARVLSRSWQLVAHRNRLAGPGDHVVDQAATTPVLVVRGTDGLLRAFPNVCRHRAGPLALCDGKAARQLHCRYHGWTYDLEGRLRHAPEMAGAEGFDVRDVRLPPLRVGEWQGLVFVTLDEDTPPLGVVYAGIAERIAPVDIGGMHFVHRDVYDVACNWKVYVDNFLEGYHVPYVHPGLAGVVDYAEYTTELADWYSLQHSPLQGAGEIYGEGEAFYYFVFPNVMLNVVPGRLQANRVLPRGPDRCRVEFDYYYAPDPVARARFERDRAFTEKIQLEDMAICEAVQRGLASGYYEPGRLSPKREGGTWHFQQLLRAAYAEPPEEAP
jgi:choline monooxygenase